MLSNTCSVFFVFGNFPHTFVVNLIMYALSAGFLIALFTLHCVSHNYSTYIQGRQVSHDLHLAYNHISSTLITILNTR